MRYEDASQTAAADHHAPVARPDVDVLPAGSYGPATGNALTGQGTTSGASGADSVAEGAGTIVAVQGAGGQGVLANGAYQVSGQYGALSIDTHGSFNYVRNAGTPDGVRDVFHYTLADASGANASTTLTIDIAQVAAAAAGQSMVALPAGVEMSDIHVNGRDLVINMPDGTQMVIPNGAVFVPQITIGDVQVPPSNVAALLIDSEPQPAAGPPQSSGGNFASDVPPLDPGVGLGDLIPPTELAFGTPQFEELAQAIDRKPTVIIETPDNPAGAIDASESVNEKGLPARNGNEPAGTGEIADGNGTNDSDSSETNSGTIVFEAKDGLRGIAVNGTDITAVGQHIAGQFGTMTITGIDVANGRITYSYTLADNTSGDSTQDVFTVVVTDRDGDTATGSLTVHIVDDQPIALNDTDATDKATHLATGNVISGADTTSGTAGADTVGADNAHIGAIAGAGGSSSTFDANGNLVVQGQFGSLEIKADGSYVYHGGAGAVGGSVDTFTYTLTDGDGDSKQATLTITNPDQVPTVVIQTPDNPAGVVNAIESVDEKGLPIRSGEPAGSGEIADGNGTNNSDPSETNTGTIVITAADGIGSVAINGTTVTGVNQHIAGADGTLTITSIDLATGRIGYSYTLADNTSGDATHDDFTVVVTDSDGDTATGALRVNIIDDEPTARNDADSIDLLTHVATGNVITGASTASPAAGADTVGADDAHISAVQGVGPADTSFDASGNLEVAGQFGTLTIKADGSYVYTGNPAAPAGSVDTFTYTLTDGDGDSDQAMLTISNPDHTPTVVIQTPDNPAGAVNATESVEEKGLPVRPGEPAGSGEIGDGIGNNNSDPSETNTGTIVLNSPDGVGSVKINGTAVTAINQQIAGADGTLTITSIDLATGHIGYSYTLTDNTSGNATHDDFTVVVTDTDGDTATGTLRVNIIDDAPTAHPDTNTVAEGASVSGNVETNDIPGADNFDAGGGVTGVVAGNHTGSAVSGGVGVTVAGTYGDLVLNADGSYTYQSRPNAVTGNATDTFTYTITDGDGDTSTTTLVINVNNATLVVSDNDAIVNEAGLVPNGSHAGDGSAVDSNGQITVSGGTGPYTFTLTSPASGAHGTLTLNTATGHYTYTLTSAVDEGNVNNGADTVTNADHFNYTVTDSLGNTVTTGVINVDIIDDVPSISASGAQPSLTVDESNLAANDSASFAGVFTSASGADTPAAITYALGITGGNGVASGLIDVASGQSIVLVNNGGVIEGHVGITSGALAFTVTVNSAGDVTLDQILAVQHPNASNPDDSVSLSADNLVTLTATITDADGDQSSATANIGQNLNFQDDGPTAAANGAALDTLVLDESRPVGSDVDGTAPAGLMTTTASFADNFVTANYGADGAGSTSYALVLNGGANIASGLYALQTSDGSPSDGDGWGQGDQIVLNLSNGVITGSANGTDYFTISIDAATGEVTFTQLNPIWHPVPGTPFAFADAGVDDDTATLMAAAGSILVQQTVTDGDGDSAQATVDVSRGVFQIQDDGPVAVSDNDSTGAGGTTATGNVITGASTDAGAAGADDAGADSPGHVIGIEGSVTGVESNGVPSGTFSAVGTYGTLQMNANGDYTYTKTAVVVGSADDVFKYFFADADGDVTEATLTIHITNNAPLAPGNADVWLDDDALANGNANGPGDRNPDTQNTTGTLVATGGDGDLDYYISGTQALPNGFTSTTTTAAGVQTMEIFQNGTLVITVTLTNESGDYTVTQNAPIQHALDGNTEGEIPVGNTVPEITIGVYAQDADGDHSPNGQIVITVDDDTPTVSAAALEPTLTVDESNLAGDDSANFSTAFTHSFGADGPAAANSISYTLGLNAGATGLVDTATQEAVVLVDNGGVIEGRTATSNALVFTVSVDSSGNVTLDQSRAVVHADPANPDDSVSLASDHLITLTQTVTDHDGDQASATIDIGQNLNFEDDGPTAHTSGSGAGSVVLDESAAGTDTAGASPPSGVASATVNLANGFVTGGAIDYGADGAAASGAVTYALQLNGANVGSGLYALDNTDIQGTGGDGDGYGQGAEIVMNQTGNVIVGSVGATEYFRITIDPNTGIATFQQSNNIWHPDAGSSAAALDDTATLTTAAASDLQVVQTITDGDGDTDSASLNLGSGVFNIQDDGPKTFNPQDPTLLNAPGAAVNFQLDPVANGGDNNILNNFGTDGPGLVRFPDTIDNTDSGMTSAGSTIWYILSADGQTLLGKTGTSAADAEASGTTIFTIHIDQASSTYSVDMDGTVDNVTNVNFTDVNFDFIGGNKAWFGIVPNGQVSTPVNDDSHDVLITPLNNTSINTSGILGGVDTGQDVGPGEGFRIDYVIDLTGSPPNNYTNGAVNNQSFDSHWSTNGASVTYRQSGGSDVKISVFDDNAASGTDGNKIVGDGVQDTISKIVISYNDGATVFSSGQLTPTASVQSVVLDGITFTYKLDADNKSVIVTNLQGANGANDTPATTVAVFTSTGYTSMQIVNVDAHDSFKFAGFGAAVPTGTPVHFSLPVQIVDADGDSVAATSTIDVTLNPAVIPLALDLNHDGQISFLDRSAGVSHDYGNGAVATAWVGPQDGILVNDANHNGSVDNASEFVFGGAGQTDLQGLAAYDSNHDGQLNAVDAAFANFAVWQDANSNGKVDAGEMTSLMARGITSIALTSDGISYNAAGGDVAVAGSGSFTWANGSKGMLADAAFAVGARSGGDEVRSPSLTASNATLMAALAAAGLSSASAGYAQIHIGFHGDAMPPSATFSAESLATTVVASAGTYHGFELSGLTGTSLSSEFVASRAAPVFHNEIVARQALTTGDAHAPAPAELLQGSQAPAHGEAQAATAAMAMAVAMPSAEQMAAAGSPATAAHVQTVAGLNSVQHNEILSKVLADSLNGGGGHGPNVEALVNQLGGHGSGHGGGNAALEALASHGAGAASFGHMAFGGAFGGLHMLGMEMMHQDAAPAAHG